MAQRGTINKVILVGYLGKDPELRYMPSGDAVAEIRIATTEVFKNKEGERVEKTEWHSVVLWRKTAEWAAEWLKKGQLVYVEGKLLTRQWEDRDGLKRYKTEIQADQVTVLGGLVGKEKAIEEEEIIDEAESSPSIEDEGDEDLPF
ncbi:MAG: single-stranded DNA-binding protein [Candidatus Marinimicrobia bacterium]|nr:single-stranded DNA-binding protein [Candidatus Neomarinimicrobiota bacterium]